MKKTIFVWVLLIAFLVLGWSTCMAEVYLVVDKTSKEIITMSEKNDTVPSSNQETVVLPGKFSNYELVDNPTNYKYEKGKFILNVAKINEAEIAIKAAEEKAQEEKLVNDRIRKIAIEQLKTEGVVFKYADKEQ